MRRKDNDKTGCELFEGLHIALVPTWELLRSLGFEDSALGLSYDFGNCKLEAIFGTNLVSREIVSLAGIIKSPSNTTLVECEMPQEVESREQGIAWVTWCIDSHCRGAFSPNLPTPWLEVGRQCQHLLPWEKVRAAHNARPCCQVSRDFARVGLRHLSELLAASASDILVTFAFDGEILTFRIAEKLIPMPADGKKWSSSFSISVQNLSQLPKRLMHDPVSFSIWENSLSIGNHRYSGVVATDVGETSINVTEFDVNDNFVSVSIIFTEKGGLRIMDFSCGPFAESFVGEGRDIEHWLDLDASAVQKLMSKLTGHVTSTPADDLAKLLAETYRGQNLALQSIKQLCDDYGVKYEEEFWP